MFFLALAPVIVIPLPTSTPLKEIGRVRASVTCTALRAIAAPTLVGLVKNDEVIGRGHQVVMKMRDDLKNNSSTALDLDRSYMETVVRALAHNLEIVDKLLGDSKRFPRFAKNDDERQALAMRDQLQAVSTSQMAALNVLDGQLETDLLGQMQTTPGLDTMKSVIGPETRNTPPPSAATPGPPTYLSVAGLPSTDPQFDPRTLGASGLLGNTAYDKFLSAIEVQQVRVDSNEHVASDTIVKLAPGCGARAVPAPSPTPLAPSAFALPTSTPAPAVTPPAKP
ncbi:MAG: hypothetical protein ABI346_08950 [Candidatus Baltobacteraceae bacterium]